MDFKTISIIKFPVESTWLTMQNNLSEIAKAVDDLEGITEIGRTKQNENIIKVVNLWKAKPSLPAIVMKYIKPEMLTWDDVALWKENEKVIEWEINSHYFSKQLDCRGITSFEPAMGGMGCKMTFSGKLEWNGKLFSVGIDGLDSKISKVAEGVLAQMIPSNLRKITEALGKYLQK